MQILPLANYILPQAKAGLCPAIGGHTFVSQENTNKQFP